VLVGTLEIAEHGISSSDKSNENLRVISTHRNSASRVRFCRWTNRHLNRARGSHRV